MSISGLHVAGACSAIALLGIPGPAPPQAPAREAARDRLEAVTDSPVSTGRGPTRGVAWGDADGDGDPDLYVTRSRGHANTLYRNDAGRFVALRESPASSDLGDSEGAVFVDYDGDGDLDLHVVGRNGGGSRLFRNQAGHFAPGEEILAGVASASMACWADYDGDAWLDVFVVGYRSEGNRLFRNLGGRSFRQVDLPPALAGTGVGRACGWSGREAGPMLAVANAQGPNVVALARPEGGFELMADPHLAAGTGYSYGLSWADVDGDGREDLFIANYDAENVLYLVRDGHLEPSPLGRPLQGPASKGHAWGDYDLDGRLDLYLANGTPRPGMLNQLYLSTDDGFRPEEGEFATHDDISAAAAWADYDGDGDLDLVAATWGAPEARNRLYRNTTDASDWIAFDLRGGGPNTRAIGARVSLHIAGRDGVTRQLHRWLGTTTGYAGQNDSVAHFGLGRASRIVSVRITWPDGASQTLDRIERGRRVTIVRSRPPG